MTKHKPGNVTIILSEHQAIYLETVFNHEHTKRFNELTHGLVSRSLAIAIEKAAKK
jgi:hypothetical protein